MAVQPVRHRPQFAKGYLLHHSTRQQDHRPLIRVYTGAAANALFHAKKSDSHGPDLVGIAQAGVVYTGVVKKIAEHGGEAAADQDVALVVSGARVTHHAVNAAHVRTTSITPTILAFSA